MSAPQRQPLHRPNNSVNNMLARQYNNEQSRSSNNSMGMENQGRSNESSNQFGRMQT